MAPPCPGAGHTNHHSNSKTSATTVPFFSTTTQESIHQGVFCLFGVLLGFFFLVFWVCFLFLRDRILAPCAGAKKKSKQAFCMNKEFNRQSFKRTILYPVISISPGKRKLTSGRNPAYLDVLTCNLLTAAKATQRGHHHPQEPEHSWKPSYLCSGH